MIEKIVDEEDNSYQGEDMTQDELKLLIGGIRKSIQEEGQVNEDKFINTQYMNDMVLLQSFISQKVEQQKAKNIDAQYGVNIKDTKDFPTLGAGLGSSKKKRGKRRNKKEPPSFQQEYQEPFEKKNVIKMIEGNIQRKRQLELEEEKKHGVLAIPISHTNKKVTNFDVLKSENGWKAFEKNLFVRGSVTSFKLGRSSR